MPVIQELPCHGSPSSSAVNALMWRPTERVSKIKTDGNGLALTLLLYHNAITAVFSTASSRDSLLALQLCSHPQLRTSGPAPEPQLSIMQVGKIRRGFFVCFLENKKRKGRGCGHSEG